MFLLNSSTDSSLKFLRTLTSEIHNLSISILNVVKNDSNDVVYFDIKYFISSYPPPYIVLICPLLINKL